MYKIDLHTLQKITKVLDYFGEKKSYLTYNWKKKSYEMTEPIENKRARNLSKYIKKNFNTK
jgi:hypothetical protein